MSTQRQSQFDRVYPVSPDVLYTAVREAVEAGPYKKATWDEFTKSGSFKSRRSFASWGIYWQGQVLPDEHGSKLVLSGGALQGGGPNSTDKLAVRTSDQLFGEVSRRCAAAIA